MIELLLVPVLGTLARLSGNGFGSRWGVSWLPEALFALVIGLVCGTVFGPVAGALGSVWSYAFMQSGTWPILPWDKEGVRDPNRSATLRPVSDWIADKLDVEFDSEAYAWIYAALKGFLITLPIGGLGLIFWPLGYELGSHVKGRVNLDPTAVAEFSTGVGAGIAALTFLGVT